MIDDTDSFSVNSLCELLVGSCYGSLANSCSLRQLCQAVLSSCVNPTSVSSNRYSFGSGGSSEFFVPNKTLLKDYEEFVQVILLHCNFCYFFFGSLWNDEKIV